MRIQIARVHLTLGRVGNDDVFVGEVDLPGEGWRVERVDPGAVGMRADIVVFSRAVD